MRNLFRMVTAVLLILGSCSFTSGQIFKLQGGYSTLFDADGGSVQFKALNYDGQVGAGHVNGTFRVGALVRTKILGNTVTVGDETVRIDLPTDIFGNNHAFLATGLGISHPYASGTVYTFIGTSSQGFVTPFFTAARSADRMAAVYLDQKLSPNLRLFSRNIVSHHTSSIQSVEWTAGAGVKMSAAGGMGSNQGYAASALDIDRQNFKLKAAYIRAGNRFERVRTPAMLTTELEKENISVAYRPVKALTLSAAHQNILQPPYNGQGFVRASVEQITTTATVATFGFGGGLYRSQIKDHSTTGANLFATREITRRLSLTGNLFHSRADIGSLSNIYTGSSRFVVNQRLSVSGVVSRSGNQTSFGVGGDITGNRISLGVNSQTVYVPLRLDRPFQQAVAVNLSANLVADMRLTVASLVSPDGHMRYTFGISRFLYRQQGLTGRSMGPAFRFAKFMVLGIVVDERGAPVEGAAIHVGNQVTYSDADGKFMVRTNKRGPHAIQVAAEEFTSPGLYENVSAPSSAMAQPEHTAASIRVVVRRVTANSPRA